MIVDSLWLYLGPNQAVEDFTFASNDTLRHCTQYNETVLDSSFTASTSHW